MALGYIFGATQGAARETKVEFRGVPENFEKKTRGASFACHCALTAGPATCPGGGDPTVRAKD